MAAATAILHLVDRLPTAGGICARYEAGHPLPAGWRDADVRARCHRHQHRWRHALTSWHSEMMKGASAMTRWAWLLPGSRLHVWQPPIRPLLFALGLRDFFQDHPAAEVWATGCPPEVADYLTEFSNGAVRVVRSGRPPSALAVRARAVLGALPGVVSILRQVPIVARAPSPAPRVDVLLYSMAISERNLRERGDHYFGRALDDGAMTVHWLYQLAGSAGRTGIESAVRETRRSVTWAHQCVGWAGVLSMLWTAASVRRNLRAFVARVPPLDIDGAGSMAFARRFVEQLMVGGTLLSELLVFRAMSAVLRATRPTAVCYPYEEKGVEHAIALAIQDAGGCRPIGFAHAAYASGYLYLQAPGAGAPWPPRPRVFAAAGRGLGRWLQREFGWHDAVTDVGSPRWTPPPPAGRHTPATRLRVLVLTSFAYELETMADWIAALPGLFDGMTVTIRPNPHAWPREQAAALERLSGVAGVTANAGASLQSQIADCDVVLFCATSAVAEAIWHGRLAVYAEWSDLWVADPTSGKVGEDAVAKCATPEALRRALVELAGMTADDYAARLAAQQEVAAQIYGPFDPDRFRDLVMESVPA